MTHSFSKNNSLNATIKKVSGGTSKVIPVGSGQIRRDAWPIWLMCIVLGLVGGFAMAPLLTGAVQETFGFTLTLDTARVILTILGGIVGGIEAHFVQEKYQSAYNAWPWLLVSLLAPVGTAVVTAAVMLIIFLVIFVVMLVLYIIGAIFAIACICGMCEGA